MAAAAAFLGLATAPPLAAQTRERPDHQLQRALESLVTGFHGIVGIYVRQLKTGRTAAVNADSVFPTASMVKVPILIGTFDAMDQGLLDFHQKLVYTDSLL